MAAASAQPLRYLSAWFCPYAHRATIALEHHAKTVPFVWVEALGWEKRASEDANKLEQGGEPAHENWHVAPGGRRGSAGTGGWAPGKDNEGGERRRRRRLRGGF